MCIVRRAVGVAVANAALIAQFEGRDVSALVDYVAAQPEAQLDAAGDPRAGMSGSSYGGGIAPLEVTRECLRATT
jgi:hypothetical protein